jgi:hypothetical protein
MKTEELKNYAKLLMSMSVDYSTGKIEGDHFANMVGLAAKNMGGVPYDSEVDTLKHIKRVSQLLTESANELIRRANCHDESKLKEPEKSLFDKMTPKLAACTYGSEQYKGYLKELKVALDHHYANNSHHPEHYPDGVNGMNLFDLLEMFFDWKAAAERHNDGDIRKSIDINHDRFSMSDQLAQIFHNTAIYLGYYESDSVIDEKQHK